MSRKKKYIIEISIHLAAVIVGTLIFFPFLWMIMMSFKSPLEMFSTTFVFHPTLENYLALFSEMNILNLLKNSLIITSSTVIVSVLVGAFAAYGFSRLTFDGKKMLLFLVLFLRMMPPIAGIMPLFLLMQSYGLTGTYFGLVAILSAFQIPLVVWMLKGIFDAIPKDIDEQAQVDGCGTIGAFVRVTLPLAASGIVATAIFAFINSWSDFLYSLIFTSASTKTLIVAIPELISELGINWGQISAAGTIAAIIPLAFAIFIQKYLIKGLTFGAVKR